MNVIVSNRQKEIIDNANIDAIKDLNGLFNVDDLINKFKNYFFSKMILDATSVVNFASKEVLTKLVDEIGAEKLIILLPVNPEPPAEFKKLLIDLKIYNFTNKIDDVVKFIDKPNAYEDIIKTLDSGSSDEMYVDSSIKEGETDESNDSVDEINSIGNGKTLSQSLDNMLNNFNLQESVDNYNQQNDEETSDREEQEHNEYNYDLNSMINSVSSNNDNMYEEKLNEIEDNTFDDEDKNTSKENDDTNTSLDNEHQNTFLISDDFMVNDVVTEKEKEKKVIGFKNVTLHAGSSSLIYMLHKVASEKLKKNVLSIEVDKNDFRFYRNNKMISTSKENVTDLIDKANEELIFIDLNEYDNLDICTEVIYLVEPSTIMLNKLMMENKNIFKDLSNKKVLLNKSLLSDSDIRTLSSEAGMGFFYNIEPLNDRIFNDTISKFLEQLNIK